MLALSMNGQRDTFNRALWRGRGQHVRKRTYEIGARSIIIVGPTLSKLGLANAVTAR